MASQMATLVRPVPSSPAHPATQPAPSRRFDFRQLRLMAVTNLPNPERGIHVTQTALLADLLEREGAQVLRVTRQTRFILKTLDILLSLWTQRQRYDMIQIQTTPYHGFANTAAVILAARLLRKRVISNYFTSAGPDFLRRHRSWAVPILRRADAVVVASEYVRNRLAELGIIATPIPHSLQTTDWGWKTRPRLEPKLLWVRRFHPECDPQMAISAFARVQKVHSQASMVMLGDGPLLPECRQEAMMLGLRNLLFPGFVRHESVRDFYDQADIFLHTSRVDNQPQSLLEAMLSGLPIVATRVGGVPELIEHGHSGLLVEPGDAQGMADAVQYLLSDPLRAQEMARRALARAQKFSWSETRLLWLKLYERVLELRITE